MTLTSSDLWAVRKESLWVGGAPESSSYKGYLGFEIRNAVLLEIFKGAIEPPYLDHLLYRRFRNGGKNILVHQHPLQNQLKTISVENKFCGWNQNSLLIAGE